MSIVEFVPIALAVIIVENYLLTRLLGIEPFFGASKHISAIIGHPSLIILNCALLGTAVVTTQSAGGFLAFAVCYLRAVLAFALVFVLFAAVQKRLEFSKPPAAFDGLPLAVVTAGLLSMVSLGFAGLNVW